MFMRDANFSLLCIDFFFSPLILICMIIFSSPVQDDIQLAFRLFSFANWGLTQAANLGMTIKLVCILFKAA